MSHWLLWSLSTILFVASFVAYVKRMRAADGETCADQASPFSGIVSGTYLLGILLLAGSVVLWSMGW